MQVIFLQDVQNVADAGDIKKVADGYARNYLLPKNLAAVATHEALKRVEKIKQAGKQQRVRVTNKMEKLAEELDGTSVIVNGRVSPTGRYYGSITPTQIADALSNAIGREMDRKIVELVSPIREPGQFEVVLHLAENISATINITAEELQ
jgi:large subunit ribosomal protein L9